jgi:hypothetical protein
MSYSNPKKGFAEQIAQLVEENPYEYDSDDYDTPPKNPPTNPPTNPPAKSSRNSSSSDSSPIISTTKPESKTINDVFMPNNDIKTKFDRGYRPTKLNTIRKAVGLNQEKEYLLEPIIQRLKQNKSHYGSFDLNFPYSRRKTEIKNFSNELEKELDNDPYYLAQARENAEKMANNNEKQFRERFNFLLGKYELNKLKALAQAANDSLPTLYNTEKKVIAAAEKAANNPSIGGKRSRRNKTVRKSRRKGTRSLRK